MSKVIWRGSTLLCPVPATFVTCGTMDAPNVFTVAWTGIINSQPAKTYISVRPERYSHDIIEKTGEFCINLPTADMTNALDYCGVRSGRDVDKFKHCALTPCAASEISAPIIEQCPVSLECRIFEKKSFETHDMYLADIVAVDADEKYLDEKGRLCLDKAQLVAYSHGEYFALGKKLGKFGYSVKKHNHKKKS